MNFDTNNDSFYVAIPNFDSHFEGFIKNDKKLIGSFIKDNKKDYSIPFVAYYNQGSRFETSTDSFAFIKPKYDVSIIANSTSIPAIGIFKQTGINIDASFATETGDYRFLNGVIDGDKLKLSTFDGTHLFLFTADIKGDSLLNGEFVSSNSSTYKWNGYANNDVKLRDPEKLTQLIRDINPSDRIKFISTTRDTVVLINNRKDKVKMIQIMGTWCPNCLDEARYFNELYKKYNKQGLEIYAVAFENGKSTEVILDKLEKYKEQNNIEYPILYGGKAANKAALDVFPYLNQIMSFPTTLYLDKNNTIRKIYTGFYGPSTGRYYEEYTQTTEKFIQDLLNE